MAACGPNVFIAMAVSYLAAGTAAHVILDKLMERDRKVYDTVNGRLPEDRSETQ